MVYPDHPVIRNFTIVQALASCCLPSARSLMKMADRFESERLKNAGGYLKHIAPPKSKQRPSPYPQRPPIPKFVMTRNLQTEHLVASGSPNPSELVRAEDRNNVKIEDDERLIFAWSKLSVSHPKQNELFLEALDVREPKYRKLARKTTYLSPNEC